MEDIKFDLVEQLVKYVKSLPERKKQISAADAINAMFILLDLGKANPEKGFGEYQKEFETIIKGKTGELRKLAGVAK